MSSPDNRIAKAASAAFGGADVESIGIGPLDAIEIAVTDDRDERWRLTAFWIGQGWPANVSALLEAMPREQSERFLVTAPSFSSGAIELLEQANMNWADELGNAHIRAPGLFVFRDGGKPVAAKPKFAWSASAIAVAEALLAKRDQPAFRTGELANLIDWSPAQVSQVLQSFDVNGWTIKYGPQRGPSSRRELHDFDGLLSAWSEALGSNEQETRLAHRTMREPLSLLVDELGPALDENVRWATGGWAAAHDLAPIVDVVPSLQIYIHEKDFDKPLTRAMRSVGLDDVSEGGKVSFHPVEPSVLALSTPSRIGRVVSAPRVYADLMRIGGRGEDAARHLKEEVLVNQPDRSLGSTPPRALAEWDDHNRSRLRQLTRSRFGTASDPYRAGTLSVSYRLLGVSVETDSARLAHILREVTDHDAGWPVWWAPQVGADRLRSVDGRELECWFTDMAEQQPSHADYWSADPKGQLCLIRPYQEDFEGGYSSGEQLDAVLQVWRVAECVAHAKRLAWRLDASGIQLMAHWTGLGGRRLVARGRRRPALSPDLMAIGGEVTAFVETTPEDYADRPTGVLAQLLHPLYGDFGLLEDQAGLIGRELEEMGRNR